MKRLLFLCTGNYYRSRLAEEYFNHHAERIGLTWLADSKGLARDLSATGTVGPISRFALAGLAEQGIPPRGASRYPVRVEADDLLSADRVIALSRREHAPMVHRYFPGHSDRVEFFEIGDIDIEHPPLAVARLVATLDQLIAELRAAVDD